MQWQIHLQQYFSNELTHDKYLYWNNRCTTTAMEASGLLGNCVYHAWLSNSASLLQNVLAGIRCIIRKKKLYFVEHHQLIHHCTEHGVYYSGQENNLKYNVDQWFLTTFPQTT
jgi:hypothetical protein